MAEWARCDRWEKHTFVPVWWTGHWFSRRTIPSAYAPSSDPLSGRLGGNKFGGAGEFRGFFCVRLHIIVVELSILEDLAVRPPPMNFQVAKTHSCFHSIAVAMYLELHGIRFSVLVSLVEGPRG